MQQNFADGEFKAYPCALRQQFPADTKVTPRTGLEPRTAGARELSCLLWKAAAAAETDSL
jgi:hypothetical protein